MTQLLNIFAYWAWRRAAALVKISKNLAPLQHCVARIFEFSNAERFFLRTATKSRRNVWYSGWERMLRPVHLHMLGRVSTLYATPPVTSCTSATSFPPLSLERNFVLRFIVAVLAKYPFGPRLSAAGSRCVVFQVECHRRVPFELWWRSEYSTETGAIWDSTNEMLGGVEPREFDWLSDESGRNGGLSSRSSNVIPNDAIKRRLRWGGISDSGR